MTQPPAGGALGEDVDRPPPGLPAVGPRAARAPLVVGVLGAAAVAVVGAVDPNRPGHYLTCPFLALTGLACPGCGGLRATHDLVHLDVAGAWAMNPLWVVLAPVLVVVWAVWLSRAWTGRPGPLPPPVRNYADSLEPQALAILRHALSCTVAGSPETVKQGLEDFIQRTGVDEVMVTGQIFDHAARLRSFEILADVMQLSRAPSDPLPAQ